MPGYPPFPRDPRAVVRVQGRAVPNPYARLEAADGPGVRDWVRAQQDLTSAFVDRDGAEWRRIRDFVTSLPLYDTDYFALTRAGEDLVFPTRPAGAAQVNLYRMPVSGGVPVLLFNPSTALSGAEWRVHESCLEASPSGRYLVFATNHSGRDAADLRVLDLHAGTLLADRIGELATSPVAWDGRSRGFYYGAFRSIFGGADRPDGLYYHELGTPERQDRCLVPLDDREQADFVALMPWRIPGSEHLIVVRYSYRHRAAGLDWLDPADSRSPVRLLDGFEADVSICGVHDGELVVATTWGAPLGRVVSMPLAAPAHHRWRERVAERDTPLAGSLPGPRSSRAVVCGDRLVATYLEQVRHVVRVFDLTGDGDAGREARALPTPVSVMGVAATGADRVVVAVSGFLDPYTFYVLEPARDMATPLTVPWPRRPGWTRGVEVRQQFVAASDGVRIPLYLIGADLDARSAPRPVLLYGYGGFGQAITPAFNADLPVWLAMGGLYALANIRGGSEYGPAWQEAARGLKRRVAFEDFHACAQWLRQAGYADREHLAIRGLSNGGLLVGASVVLHPEDCGAAIAEVPLLDMLQMLGVPGMDALFHEYGRIADDPAALDYVLGYSPVHNVRPQTDYPAVLAVPAAEDPRAAPSQSWKWIALLQENNPGGRPALLYTVPGEGHVTWSTRSLAEAMATEMRFLQRTVAGLRPVHVEDT